jgi:dihydroxyacetone kinase-like predicted kinase
MNEIFRGLNVDYLIEGGQTMNPSTEDMINAIAKVNADTIYILPNNKNIILAAEQAMHLTKDKEIVVIPSKTIPQGISAIISFIPDMSSEQNKELMIKEMKKTKTGQITYAVRNTMLDGFDIKQNDIMGIGDTGILAVGKEIEETAFNTVEAMIGEDSELISIYYGSDVEDESANRLLSRLQEAYDSLEIELHRGGQPIYYYVMSVE